MGSVVFFKDQKYEKIRKQIEEQKSLFVDNQFPATNASLGTAHTFAEADGIEWKRPRDISDDPHLVHDGDSLLRISGGELSSFWFLQSLQVLAGLKELLFKVIVNYGEQEWQDGIPERYTGLFRFRFWRFGQWVEVVVDDYLPCVDGKLVFCHSDEPGQFWPALLEKAYAKLLGSYGALEEGHISDALVDLTGGVSEIIDLKSGDLSSNEDSRSFLFQSLNQDMIEHSIICASIPRKDDDDSSRKTMEGFVKGRMYHVTAVKKIHLTDNKLRNLFKGREKVAVVRVRDTRAGKGSSTVNSPTRSTDSSAEADNGELNTSQLTRMLSRNAAWAKLRDEERRKHDLALEHEGEVWMPFEDFTRYFHELIIVRLYNNNIMTKGRRWKEVALRSAWTHGERGTPLDRSGGGNSTSSDHFLRNPQFLVDISSQSEELVMQLLQWDGVEPSSASSGSPPPKILPAALTVFRVEGNRRYRLHRQWGFTPTILSLDHQRRRELQYRGVLERGRYIIVPSAFKPGSIGQFLLRIISLSSINLREITQDIPKELCGLSCIASPALWVTVVSVKAADGLPHSSDIMCKIKCEKETVRTSISRDGKDVSWDDPFIFYRRRPERPITVKVYRHNKLARNEFLGLVDIQARVNHSPSALEVSLLDKKGSLLSERRLTIETLTEDDLMAI